MAEKEMRFVEMTLQGVRVHYEIGGHGERRVVLLHGWGCSEKLMAGISDALTPDMTVLRAKADFRCSRGVCRILPRICWNC